MGKDLRACDCGYCPYCKERSRRKELEAWQAKMVEEEAACCPEDVGFGEYIPVLHKRIAELEEEVKRLRSRLEGGRVMAEHGFKAGILPDHCGKCVFLEWEEYICNCTHPAFVNDAGLMEYLRDELGPDPSDEEIITAAITWHGVKLEDADWHGYDCVCDLFVGHTNMEGRDAAIGAAKEAYEQHALALWRKHETTLNQDCSV